MTTGCLAGHDVRTHMSSSAGRTATQVSWSRSVQQQHVLCSLPPALPGDTRSTRVEGELTSLRTVLGSAALLSVVPVQACTLDV